MITLNFTDTDMLLLELAVQELPEKARNGLGTKINQQILAQQQQEAPSKAAEEAQSKNGGTTKTA